MAAAVALASCETDGNTSLTRAMKPLSPELVSELEQKHMPKESPILVRIFKEESEMEIWKQDESGLYALLKTYPICRWSGDLGPKVKEGDRQAPEGYYTITPGQMNPNSNYYLSFNLGFPNAYDRANDRTGAFLMVHGDCSSAGCYAMTDDQMGEIYALGRESFFGGQREFQVQAYPFRMTPLNMAKHRNSPSLAFWRMIKEGYDHFEVTRREPKVDVCDKHYVFDAEPAPGSSFNPKGRCPQYEVQADIAAAVKEKRDNDEREFAALVSRGTPTVAGRGSVDGGMNSVFAARFKPADAVDNDGRLHIFTTASAPNPGPAPSPAPAPPRVPETASTSQTGSTDNPFERMTSTVSKWVGIQQNPEPPPPDPAATAVVVPKPKAKPVQTAAAIRPQPQQQPASQQPSSQPQQAAPAPVSNPQPQTVEAQPSATPPPTPAASNSNASESSLLSGAQPMVPSTFDNRWPGVH
jgi:murein L,D-transpeptidase YafK/outer membrane biosynthesis protein TonB